MDLVGEAHLVGLPGGERGVTAGDVRQILLATAAHAKGDVSVWGILVRALWSGVGRRRRRERLVDGGRHLVKPALGVGLVADGYRDRVGLQGGVVDRDHAVGEQLHGVGHVGAVGVRGGAAVGLELVAEIADEAAREAAGGRVWGSVASASISRSSAWKIDSFVVVGRSGVVAGEDARVDVVFEYQPVSPSEEPR